MTMETRTNRDAGREPAFPAMHYDLTDGEHGLSIRDYLAAHAPHEVPAWFTPTPVPGKPEPPRGYADDYPEPDFRKTEAERGYDAAHEEAAEWRRKVNEFHSGTEWKAARARYEADYTAWVLRDRLSALSQWAYAYADAMLKARQS